jgi:hypothetical protein
MTHTTEKVLQQWHIAKKSMRSRTDPQSWQHMILNEPETMIVARACATTEEDAKERAELIVKAVNERQKMIDALQKLVIWAIDNSNGPVPKIVVDANELLNNAKTII